MILVQVAQASRPAQEPVRAFPAEYPCGAPDCFHSGVAPLSALAVIL